MRAIRALILVAALYWVGKMGVDAIKEMRAGNLELHLRPGWLALSGLFVLATYALLIRAWLYILVGLSGKSIPFMTGARIWFISNLGQLLPGRVWGIIQMGLMSAEEGIDPVAAGAASVINTMVNIATGAAVGTIAGASVLAIVYLDARIAWAIAGLAIVGLVALPWLIPWAFDLARRLGANVPQQRVPPRIIAISAAANVVAWILYGAAFMYLNRAVLDFFPASLTQHIALNATSYVAGYLAIITPAGLGVRETALRESMVVAGMATPAAAGAVAVVSRIWLLIIQVLPALIFLAYRRPRADEKDR